MEAIRQQWQRRREAKGPAGGRRPRSHGEKPLQPDSDRDALRDILKDKPESEDAWSRTAERERERCARILREDSGLKKMVYEFVNCEMHTNP